MRYLGNRLVDFDEICMTMHISHAFQPIGDQKFENPRLHARTAAILNIEKR